MKKLNVLFLSLLALGTIVSCNNDDDNDSSATIEGKWQITQEGESLTTLEPADNEGNCGLDTIEFLSGGVFKEVDFYNNEAGCTSDNDTGTWSKNGNTLTVKFAEGGGTGEILELTASTLKIKTVDGEGTWIEVYKKK